MSFKNLQETVMLYKITSLQSPLRRFPAMFYLAHLLAIMMPDHITISVKVIRSEPRYKIFQNGQYGKM